MPVGQPGVVECNTTPQQLRQPAVEAGRLVGARLQRIRCFRQRLALIGRERRLGNRRQPFRLRFGAASRRDEDQRLVGQPLLSFSKTTVNPLRKLLPSKLDAGSL